MLQSIIILLMLSSTVQACSAQPKAPVLEYKIRAPKIEVENPPLLILLHGVGSNESDLFQLADYLPDRYMVVTARAPFVRSKNSFKWYDVDFSSGSPVINYEQAEESRSILKQFIQQLKSLHDFDQDTIIVGGFSQGAIIAYNVGLTEPDLIHGVIALSGRVLDEVKPMVKSDRTRALNILIVHGTQDRVLPIDYARRAKQYLEQGGFGIDYHEIEAGHTINNEAIAIVNNWLLKG